MPNSYDKGDLLKIKGRFGNNPTTLAKAPAEAATTITVRDATGYAATDSLMIDAGGLTEETKTVSSVSGNVITLTAGLTYAHNINEPVMELVDPATVTLKVRDPAGATTTSTYAAATVTRDSLGVFSKQVSLNLEGAWLYRWEGTGAAESAEEGSLHVRETVF